MVFRKIYLFLLGLSRRGQHSRRYIIAEGQSSQKFDKQGHAVRLWGIGEERRRTLGRTKRGKGGEGPAQRGMVTVIRISAMMKSSYSKR